MLLDVDDPANELWKLAYGSFTLDTRPLRTTQPVTTMNKSSMTLYTPMTFMPRTPQRGRNVCRAVIDTITAIAIPRSSQSVAVLPAATMMFEANTTHPEAIKVYKISTEGTILGQRRTCEPECDGLNGKNDRDQELGSAIGGFEVDFLSSAARYHTSELEPYT